MIRRIQTWILCDTLAEVQSLAPSILLAFCRESQKWYAYNTTSQGWKTDLTNGSSVASPPGLFFESEIVSEPMIVPGPQGSVGATGGQGPAGLQGPIGWPGRDGEDADTLMIPGPQGPIGSQGSTGAQGPATHFLVDDRTEEPPMVPPTIDSSNPVSSVTTPAVPATTVAVKNSTGRPVTVFIKGGTLTVITLGGVATGISAAAPAGSAHSIPLAINQTIAITYTVAPTWVWVGAQL